MDNILVIKCNVFIPNKDVDDLYDNIASQMEDGLVLLPPYCEVKAIIPGDCKIKIIDAKGKIINEGEVDD